MHIVVERTPDAIIVPAKALFTRSGNALVYVADGDKCKPVEVRVLARNPDEVAIEGSAEGDLVCPWSPLAASWTHRVRRSHE